MQIIGPVSQELSKHVFLMAIRNESLVMGLQALILHFYDLDSTILDAFQGDFVIITLLFYVHDPDDSSVYKSFII